jgi:hypothetical protein
MQPACRPHIRGTLHTARRSHSNSKNSSHARLCGQPRSRFIQDFWIYEAIIAYVKQCCLPHPLLSGCRSHCGGEKWLNYRNVPLKFSCFSLINILSNTSVNMQILKQFQRLWPITTRNDVGNSTAEFRVTAASLTSAGFDRGKTVMYRR